MRVSRLLAAAAVAAAILCTPSAARADIFVSPFLGIKFKGSGNQLDLDVENGAQRTSSSVGISGVLVMDAGPGVEIDIAHQSRFFERDDGTQIVTRSGVTTLSGNLMLALPVSITRDGLRPYGVVGLGWMHAAAKDLIGFNPVNNDFLGLSLGVGAVGFLSPVVGLRFDLRYLKSVSSSDTSAVSNDLARLKFWRATIGVVFR